MIISFTGQSYSQQRYFICLRQSIEERTVLHRAKVKSGTYAGDLIANLYDAIFRRSLELKRDYAEYYRPEYATFAEYLHKRFLFPWKIVREVDKEWSHSQQIIYFYPNLYFLHEQYGLDFLQKLLEPRRTK